MDKLNLICPNCKSNNARQWSRDSGHFYDKEFYEVLKQNFGENADCEDYYYAKCICDDCKNHFETKVIIDIKVVEIKYKF